jgi:hypothetical protein
LFEIQNSGGSICFNADNDFISFYDKHEESLNNLYRRYTDYPEYPECLTDKKQTCHEAAVDGVIQILERFRLIRDRIL